MVDTIPLLAVLVIDHRIAEIVYMAGSLPNGGMHEYRGVNADDIVMHARHGIPPMVPDIPLQLTPPWTVVVHGTQSVVDLARLKHKTVLFGM